MSHGKVKTVFESIFGLNVAEYSLFVAQYSEPQRHYHSLDHVEDCLLKCEEVENFINDLKPVQTAILFHDYYYDPKRNDNEEKSADYTFNLLKNNSFPEEFCIQVKELINLTKHPSVPKTADEEYLLDIDLSILGSPPETYHIYEDNIRQEYMHVPKVVFSFGRKKLLKKFLNQERIYYSEYFHKTLEEQSRENLKWAIKQL